MCDTVAEAREHILGLLLRGYSPEEVEERLGQGNGCVLAATALTDPNNVLMVEVADDGTRSG